MRMSSRHCRSDTSIQLRLHAGPNMSARAVILCVMNISILLLDGNIAEGAFQSAGCSDEGCGIPCYLRSAEDLCHYTDHSSSPCDDGGGDDLLTQLFNLNSTLVRLQEKLIQKGVIPAGDNCRPLPTIDHGGVIYSDLLISTGVTGTYVCEEGYSLHGHGKYECAVDGVWLGNSTGQSPTCEDSLVICSTLVAVPNGHISYKIRDTTLIKPGDVVVYSCKPPYELEGSSYRVCLSNGTWTDQEPKCIVEGADPTSESSEYTANPAGIAVGSIVGILLAVALVGAIVALFYYKKKKKGDYRGLEGDNTDGNGGASKQTEESERQTLVETLQSQ